jgi:hypothetical protein
VSSNLSTRTNKTSQLNENKWDKAIKDAENEIEQMRKQSYRLRHAVQIFKKNKQDGVPWPGDVAEMRKADTSASKG